MDVAWLTHLEALAICFASSGVVLMMTVYFIVRTSSGEPEYRIASEDSEPRPMDLETLRLEGYKVLEVYDDGEHWLTSPDASSALPTARIVRTAKVLDPESGAVHLMKVQTLVKPW